MSDERRQRADERLAAAFAEHGLADMRPVYRQRLRQLRDVHPEAFEQALRHYDDVVLPALAGDDDPVEAWIAYGSWLAELTSAGRLTSIRSDGRAAQYRSPYAPGHLVLYVPESERDPVLSLMMPAAPSPAQQATHDLLVAGRVSLV